MEFSLTVTSNIDDWQLIKYAGAALTTSRHSGALLKLHAL